MFYMDIPSNIQITFTDVYATLKCLSMMYIALNL